MGKDHSRLKIEQSKVHSQIRFLTPIQLWNQSQHTIQDLAMLLQISWREWMPAISTYLKTVNNKEKYQLYITTILQYLRKQPSAVIPEYQNKDIFLYFSIRLAHSFFVLGQFHEVSINLNLKPKEKLLFLYQYYSLSQQQFQRAIICNYPSIFTQFAQFVADLIESEIILAKLEHFKRFILSDQKAEVIKSEWEIAAKFYPLDQRQRILQDIRKIADSKTLYFLGIQQFMKLDNADTACQLIAQLQLKGYKLNVQQQQYFIRISLYSLFIYSLGKLSLSFSQFRQKSLQDIIHLFYTTQNIQDTPQLLRCFQLKGQLNLSSNDYLLDYCFSVKSHISVMIRLFDHGFITFTKNFEQFSKLKEKIVRSRCQVGKYSRLLNNLIADWKVPQIQLKKFNKLLTLASIINIFGLNLYVLQLKPFIQKQSSAANNQQISHFQEQALKIIKMLINGFFTHTEIQNKTIQIQDQKYAFVTLYDFLHFLRFLKDYLGKFFLNQNAIHQLLFKELIKHELYQQISVLLKQQNLKTYRICFETVEMLIIQHLIELISKKRVKKIENDLALLFSAIRLHIKKQTNHYVAAYYKYFKYLQDKDILIPTQIKDTINLKHLYYIADNYSSKLESLDFNYLFTQQSCIRQHYSDIQTVYVPPITEQFFKFKIYLCSKCFNYKKTKLGYQIIEQILVCEPPWLSTQLIKILKETNIQDEHFISVAFKHCRRGQDLQYILKVKEQIQSKKSGSSRLSIKNIKKLGDDLLNNQKFICLDNDLIIHQEEFGNLVAQITFGKEEAIRKEHTIFFKLLTIQPLRSLNYALNYNIPASFILNFITEGVKRSVIHITNPLPLLLRYLYFKLLKQQKNHQYVNYKQYCNAKIEDIVQADTQRWNKIPSTNSYLLATFKKMLKNYQFSKMVSTDFIEMYVVQSMKFKFYYDEGQRKQLILELRQQPMAKDNVHILRKLCNKLGIDIVQLSVYELIGKVNCNEQLDKDAWEIVQKLIFWGEQSKTAMAIVIRLSQKIESLQLLIKIYDYVRQREAQFKDIVTDDHLAILVSLAAVERDKNLFGVIPQHFFERKIGVYESLNRGSLSQSHRRILQNSGSITNIFVLSKALFLIYGCDQQIQKVILGEFSLKQPDSQEFQLLRKKIKIQSS